jgi:lipopolysaccharide biosynthesis glycosyltransferase
MNQKLIYQVKLGKSILYDFCTDSVKKYADRIGATYICQTEPILKICPDPKTSGRSFEAWHKIPNIPCLPIYEKETALSYFPEYDQICIIDADIYIKPSTPNIFNELPEQYCFGGVVERSMPITEQYRKKILHYSQKQYGPLRTEADFKWDSMKGAEFMNMGLMLMNKSIYPYLRGQTPKKFLSRPEFKRFVDGLGDWKRSTDQTLLNYWLKKEQIPTKHLDWRWNTLYKGIQDSALKDSYFIHFFLKGKLPKQGEDLQMLKNIVSHG